MKKLAILLTLALLGAGIAYLPSWGTGDIAEMSLQRLGGGVTILRGGDLLAVDESESLRPGDLVTTDENGEAFLRLSGDRRAWLHPATKVLISDDRSLDARSGEVKIRADEPTKVMFDDVAATAAHAHFRVDQAFGAARAASYEGQVRLSTPGQAGLTLDRLFEATVAAGGLPATTRPYHLKRDDWDTERLGAVIDLDQRLNRLVDGLASQLGSSRPSLDYFRSLAGKNVAFVRGFLKRPTKDLLLGFTVAESVQHKSLERSFRSAFRLHDRGGRWGIVASILGARPRGLVADLEKLILATGVVERDKGGRLASRAEEPSFTLAAGSSSSDGGGAGNVVGDITGGGDGDPGDKPKPSDDEAQDCANTAECSFQDITGQQFPGSGDDEGDGGDKPKPDPTPSSPPPLTEGLLGN